MGQRTLSCPKCGSTNITYVFAAKGRALSLRDSWRDSKGKVVVDTSFVKVSTSSSNVIAVRDLLVHECVCGWGHISTPLDKK